MNIKAVPIIALMPIVSVPHAGSLGKEVNCIVRFPGSLNSLIAMLRKYYQSQYLLPPKRTHSQRPPHPSFLIQASGPSCIIILQFPRPALRFPMQAKHP